MLPSDVVIRYLHWPRICIELQYVASVENHILLTALCSSMSMNARTNQETLHIFRVPSAFPLLKPEFVASELVDGMLRNKSMLLLPKSMTIFVVLAL